MRLSPCPSQRPVQPHETRAPSGRKAPGRGYTSPATSQCGGRGGGARAGDRATTGTSLQIWMATLQVSGAPTRQQPWPPVRVKDNRSRTKAEPQQDEGNKNWTTVASFRLRPRCGRVFEDTTPARPSRHASPVPTGLRAGARGRRGQPTPRTVAGGTLLDMRTDTLPTM